MALFSTCDAPSLQKWLLQKDIANNMLAISIGMKDWIYFHKQQRDKIQLFTFFSLRVGITIKVDLATFDSLQNYQNGPNRRIHVPKCGL